MTAVVPGDPPMASPPSPLPASAEGADVSPTPAIATAPELDPAVAALCTPVSEAEPCGPDLDANADMAYLNFFASMVLPSSFFAVKDGKPFFSTQDESFAPARDALPGQVAGIEPLLKRTRDLRLLVIRAQLLILNRNIGGFAVTLAALAECLDRYWDAIHPRPTGADLESRVAALAALDSPTVTFSLQYAPLFEARRIGAISFRSWMIASGEVKPRTDEQRLATSAITEAMADAEPEVLATARRHVAMVKASLDHIRGTFLHRGTSCGLEKLPALVQQISVFIDPLATQTPAPEALDGADPDATKDASAHSLAGAPASLAQAKAALAAIADYYSRLEPSSPTLPLVRQAHQLIGKSFIEIMSILVPTQMEKASFQIGGDQVFELPVSRLAKVSGSSPDGPKPDDAAGLSNTLGSPSHYSVQSRSQAIALLEQVQRFFRAAEPSSPVPMLCERARVLAERDFMGVLRDVLPKATLKNVGSDK